MAPSHEPDKWPYYRTMLSMREMIDEVVVTYAEEHSTPPPPHLEVVHESTRRDFPAWSMMVGRQEGRFLELLVFAMGATSVLEIGCFTGYSSLSMAAGLPPGGKIITCDIDPVHVATGRANIGSSPYADRIEIREGPALETLETLAGPFDLVFIDADKEGYDAYFEAVLPKLAPRGLIVLDNTLFGGSVLPGAESSAPGDALRRLNDKLVSDPRIVCAMTTIRDGVTLIRRSDS